MTTEAADDKPWRDDPITHPDQDRFQRLKFARQGAALISGNHDRDSSVVYGLEGPWGSGKSSAINLLLGVLADGGEGWQIARFTPWAASGVDALLGEFFNCIAEVMPTGRRGEKARVMLGRCAEVARPLAALVPVAGPALAETVEVGAKYLERPWHVRFEEASSAIREAGRPVLVVVDDIDRLQAAELMTLLRVVRLLGRFPGVDYLLAYDEATLIETLQHGGGLSPKRARVFMEKIVQYPLSMPPLLRSSILRMLDAGITRLLGPERLGRFGVSRFRDVLTTVMPSQLRTPRAVERYLAQVAEQIVAHDASEVEDVDLLLLTFLRVQFPDLFGSLQRWKPHLTKQPSPGYWMSGMKEPKPVDWEPLLAMAGTGDDREDAEQVMRGLFPALTGRNSGREPGERRMAHPDYFDRYLAQTVPEDDVADAAVAEAVSRAASGEAALLTNLLTVGTRERSALALAKARAPYLHRERRFETDLRPPCAPALLAAGMALLVEVDDSRYSLYGIDDALSSWMSDVLLMLAPDHDADALGAALAACPDLNRRCRVVKDSQTWSDDHSPATARATATATLAELAHRLAGEASEAVLAHLAAGDDADDDLWVLWLLLNFVLERGDEDEFKKRIEHGLAEEQFRVEDIAARCVSVSYIVGVENPMPHLAGFDGALFTRLTGQPAASASDVNAEDWPGPATWTVRREFASTYTQAADVQAGHDAHHPA